MISRLQLTTHFIGTIAVIAAIAVTGWQRNSEAAPPADTATMPAAKKSSANAGSSLKVTVSLSPAVAKQAAPDDVVFIFARAAHGPRMPLAIVRKQVKDLPATIVLGDSQSMSPEMKLSSAPELIVVARVSKSGMANAKNGDLEGVSAPVKYGSETVAVTIANVVTGQKESGSPHSSH